MDLDVATHPKRNEFVINIPAGTQISDPTIEPGFFNTREETRIDLDSLGRVAAQCLAVNEALTAPEAPSKSRSYLVLAILNICVIAVGLGAWWYRRGRFGRHPSAVRG